MLRQKLFDFCRSPFFNSYKLGVWRATNLNSELRGVELTQILKLCSATEFIRLRGVELTQILKLCSATEYIRLRAMVQRGQWANEALNM